jgi:hypothetical protein
MVFILVSENNSSFPAFCLLPAEKAYGWSSRKVNLLRIRILLYNMIIDTIFLSINGKY